VNRGLPVRCTESVTLYGYKVEILRREVSVIFAAFYNYITVTVRRVVSDIAVFVLKRDVKLQLTNLQEKRRAGEVSRRRPVALGVIMHIQ